MTLDAMANPSPAAARTRVLGLVIPMGVKALLSDPYLLLLIQGVSGAATAHDHSVMLWVAEPDYERRAISQVMQGGLIDGIILASQLNDDPLLQALTEGSLPFVLVGRHASSAAINYIDVDNLNSARQAVNHLLRLGRRRVATITGPQNMCAGADRAEGYTTALRQRGLAVDPNLIADGNFTEADAYAAMQRLLPFNPDAVFAASDVMAVGALRALRDAGRRVPEDVALIGFDDMPIAASSNPALTTVRQPVQRTGQAAAEMLIDLIEHPDAQPRRIVLPTELVIRASCGSKMG
jgi:LacI family transcriptional regulator